MNCEYCGVELHQYHADPITGCLYEGNEKVAGPIHTVEVCRDRLKELWKNSHDNEGVGGYWHTQYRRVEDELDKLAHCVPQDLELCKRCNGGGTTEEDEITPWKNNPCCRCDGSGKEPMAL